MPNPGNCLDDVRRLAADVARCFFFNPVSDELRRWGLEGDDLREIIMSELGEIHCFKSKPTLHYYPQTISDYYSVWVDVCGGRMFLKLLIFRPEDENELLVVTSFKKDNWFNE